MPSLTKGRFSRAMALARLGAKAAAGKAREVVSRGDREVHVRLARTLTEELGAMRGLPMKVGQILSYMDGVLPEEIASIYTEALAELQAHAPVLDAAACLDVVRDEIGLEAFDEFDPSPVASASIGQVYRAVHRGRPVAVKVQYPGIAEATQADLDNVGSLTQLLATLLPTVDVARLVGEFQDRLVDECDYEAEASWQRRFAAAHAHHPAVVVPEVIDEACSEHVLTTAWIEGQTLDAFVASATEDDRNHAGVLLFEVAFGTLLRDGFTHADPHPGNLLFDVDGGLGILDFGCVQPVDDDARQALRRLIRTAVDGGDVGAIAAECLGLADLDSATDTMVRTITLRVLEPILAPQPYRFSSQMARALARDVVEAKLALSSRYMTRRGRFRVERDGIMLIVRNLFGLASIWGRLESEADFRALAAEMVRDAPSA